MIFGLKTLIIDPFSSEAVDQLKNSPFLDCTYFPGISDEELTLNLIDIQVLVVRGSRKITSRHILAAPRLRYILLAASSNDNIDLHAASLKGVEIINCPGVSYRATAELAIGNTINLLRQIPAANRKMKAGIWDRSSSIGEQIEGKTALIVGYGHLGQKIEEYLSVFGANVLAWGRRRSNTKKVTWVTNLAEGVAYADIIYLCLPATPETQGIFSKSLIAEMKPNAVILNMGRGELVDEDALYDALRAQRIQGAAIDVWQSEPNYHLPLAALENVIATPHSGGNTALAHREMIFSLRQTLESRLTGSVPIMALGSFS